LIEVPKVALQIVARVEAEAGLELESQDADEDPMEEYCALPDVVSAAAAAVES